MKVILASPRGFCAGVKRAIDMVTFLLDSVGSPVYVYHEVVHNRYVVDELRKAGAVFIENLDEVPERATLVFSAHGVSKAIQADASRRDLNCFDATCPLVSKVHGEVVRWHRAGYQIVMIGHRNHAEVIGTMGQVPDRIRLVETASDVDALVVDEARPMGYVMQTTLSVDEAETIVDRLRQRYPKIEGPSKADICYATKNRQDIVKRIAPSCDLVLIVGSKNSSNSNRLREVAEGRGVLAHLIDDAGQIDRDWFPPGCTVGVSAGASAPEILVEGVLARLGAIEDLTVEIRQGAVEELAFAAKVKPGKSASL